MKLPRCPHRWDVSPKRAMAIQRQLADRVTSGGLRGPVRRVAGLDMAFSKDGATCRGAVVLWDVEDARVIEQYVAERALRFPYVPGLLSFREAPTLLAALRKLRTPPDVLLCDGQGIAHPRRFGIASHVGMITGIPAIGCGKSRLIGAHDQPAARRGAHTPLMDDGEIIGAVLRTRDRVKPVYVSVGHGLDLETAVRIVLDCGGGYRLPEPVRRADILSKAPARNVQP